MQLKPGDNLVGRPPLGGPSPDVSLPDPKKFISRKHAVLRVANGQVYIIDKGSDNGTRVNGRRIDEEKPYLLEIGRDRIEIEGRVLVVRESRAG
jgi:pSer/pThr/pTyr-binding forkhead associated (FHA) protein